MTVIDNIMSYFTGMEKEDNTLMVNEGGQKVDLWASAAKTAKDIYYQSLFSGGEIAMPTIEKILGTESKHQVGMLMRYLSGSGEDMPLYEDQGKIDIYLQTVDKIYAAEDNLYSKVWTPTTNREPNPNTGIPYADEGWEYMQIDPRQVAKEMGIAVYSSIYDKLGTSSTVRRRELEGGDYEYMIVEPWDLIRGSEKDSNFFQGGRMIPEELAFLHRFAPDFLSSIPDIYTTAEFGGEGMERISMNLSDYGRDWLENKAKPFNITGRSIISSNSR